MGRVKSVLKRIPFIKGLNNSIKTSWKNDVKKLLESNSEMTKKNEKLIRNLIREQEELKKSMEQLEKSNREYEAKILEMRTCMEEDVHKVYDRVRTAEINSVKAVDNAWKNYYAEQRRRDDWKVRAEEVSRQAGDKKIWVIKCPAPDSELKSAWGDYPFAKSLAKNLERLGAYVVIDLYQDWSCQVAADYVIVLRGTRSYHPDRTNKKCVYIMWNISHPEDITLDEYNLYDIVCVGSSYYAKQLKGQLTIPVYTLEQCTDTELFYPAEKEPKKLHDYIFVGNSRGVRRESVLWSVDMRLPIEIWGTGWTSFLGSGCTNVVADKIENNLLPDLYRSSLATINDHWQDMLKYQFINNRIFDAVACGLPVITDYCEDLYKIFGDSLLYYRNEEEFRQCILKIENNYDEIRANTLAMWDIIKEKYSFEARAKQIVDIIKEYKSNTSQQAMGHAPASL